MHQYNLKYPASCPSCHTDSENMEHFWNCQASTRLEWRRNFLKDLQTKLIALKTGPQVRDLLISKLRAVLDGEDPSSIPEDPSLDDICSKQTQIRWDQLLRGRFAQAWNTHHRTQPGTTPLPSYSQLDHRGDQLYFDPMVATLWESRNQD